MELKKIFKKDIARPINGVVKADQTENETVFVELDEYVITNELMKHIEKFFEFYMPSVYDPEKAAVAGKSGIWVSGFFGSGKSHFIKILSYLFKNIDATNGFSSRTAFDFFSEKLKDEPMLVGSIEQAIQKQNKVILFNIDSRADTDDREDAILKVFLKVFNEEMGYSGDHAHIAHLERDLDSRGLFESFQTEFEEITGVNWKEQRDSFDFYRDFIAKALAKVTNQSLDSTRQWVEKLEENFPLDIANFCKWVKEYLDEDQSRRLLFFVDEVGQYIGSNTQMMLKLQTITENLGTICGGRAWVIVTSQEDIDAVLGQMQGSKGQDFSKIQGRFQRISLSSSNTNEVIEKRLLEKNDDAKSSLVALYEDKGDIIRSQLSFEQTNSAELKNYTDTEEFVNSYPFIPYQYNLVQKIFTGISRAGASGQHMSKGERSLIDAFQIASNLYSEDSIGRLVPVYSFYNSIKKFLDTAVVRDINQASEKASISDFAISVLQTLFMIRYVDEIKSTIDNLVTLCINEVDQDKRELRLNIEAGLEALERNNLVARQGDEYIFLTNEEKEIEKEIQNTELELSEETAELSAIIFNEVLRRTEKYTYPENKQNFPIAYFCNGMPFGGKVESDIIFKVVSPIDNDYESYNDTTCVNYSADNVLVKLEDNQRLFDELRKYIKTQKYLKKGKSNGKEQEQLRHQKAQENQEARRRLVDEIEVLMKQADYYALGNTYDAKGSSPVKMLEGACHYVVTNTFQHLKMVKPFAGSNIRTEIQQTLVAGQSSQVDIDLGDAEINPLAVAEIEKHIAISDEHGYPVIAAELIKKFTKRPYGWNTDEIRLMLARLGAAGKITFQANQQDIELKHLFDHLDKTQRLANLRIRRIKQQSEANLKKAGKLYRDLNFGTAPSTEPELFVAATEKLTNWLDKMKGFQSKAETGNYPGVTEIQDGIILIGSLVEANSSYQFIESFLANDDELCDFEEEYESLENFYEQQFIVWQQLAHSLDIKFATNASFLEKDEEAKQALDKLAAIYGNPRPYREIRNVKPLIEKVDAINNELMDKQRKFVTGKLQNQITDVQGIIADAGAPAEISNQALLPFQDAIKRIETARSVADIKNELSEADDWFNQAEILRNNYIRRQQELKRRAEEEAKKKAEAATKPVESQGSLLGAGNTDTAYKTKPATEAPQVQEAAVKAKPTKSVDAMEVYKGLSTSMYMESVEDVDNYLNALREKLVSLVESDHKVRIK